MADQSYSRRSKERFERIVHDRHDEAGMAPQNPVCFSVAVHGVVRPERSGFV